MDRRSSKTGAQVTPNNRIVWDWLLRRFALQQPAPHAKRWVTKHIIFMSLLIISFLLFAGCTINEDVEYPTNDIMGYWLRTAMVYNYPDTISTNVLDTSQTKLIHEYKENGIYKAHYFSNEYSVIIYDYQISGSVLTFKYLESNNLKSKHIYFINDDSLIVQTEIGDDSIVAQINVKINEEYFLKVRNNYNRQ